LYFVEFISYSGVSREVFWICYSLPFFGNHFEFALFWQSFGNFCNFQWSLLATIRSFGHQRHISLNLVHGSLISVVISLWALILNSKQLTSYSGK